MWSESDADVVAYMDVDLSTDLDAVLPLVAPLVSGHSDLAIGSRLDGRSRVVRGPKREVISRCYNTLLHVVLRTRFHDAQCGFKAGRRRTIQALLPAVQDDGWFFDTELLVAAQRAGLRIHEVPVDWVDDPDSRVDVWRTAVDDLKGVWRVLRHRRVPEIGDRRPDLPDGMAGQLAPFATIGVVCTLLYVVGFNLLRQPLGVAGQRRRPHRHDGAEHRGQPPLHLRLAGPAGTAPATTSRPVPSTLVGLVVSFARPRPGRPAGDVAVGACCRRWRSSAPAPSPPSCASWACGRGCSTRPGRAR